MEPEQQGRALQHGLSMLPFEVLVNILSHVPLKERLISCACVCKAWSAAADAACSSLTVQLFQAPGYTNAERLARWLSRNAHVLTKLDIKNSLPMIRCVLQFPFQKLPQLQSLSVIGIDLCPPLCLSYGSGLSSGTGCTEQTGGGSCSQSAAGGCHRPLPQQHQPSSDSSSSSSSSSSVLPHLTHLSLDSNILGLAGMLQGQLSCLSSLRQLCLISGEYDEFEWAEAVAHLLNSLWPYCASQLARVHLSHAVLKPAALQQLSCLQALQQLVLHVPVRKRSENVAPWLVNIPGQQLTQLLIKASRFGPHAKGAVPVGCCNASSTSIGRLASFTMLQDLEVQCGDNFEPMLLSGLQHLTRLHLTDVSLPRQTGSSAMLSVLPHLQQLQALKLNPRLLPQPYAAAEQYSALTASSHLTVLDLYWCRLPAGAGLAMFPGTRSLPQLRVLRLTQPTEWEYNNLVKSRDDPEDYHTPGPPFGPGNIDALVHCCPKLEQLLLAEAVAAEADLSALQRSTGLAQLQLAGAAVSNAAANQTISRLTQLRRLDLSRGAEFTDAGLVRLTALKQLTSLEVRQCGLSVQAGGAGRAVYLCHYKGAPTVSERLLENCMNSLECMHILLKERDEQLAEVQAALAASKQQVAAVSLHNAAEAPAAAYTGQDVVQATAAAAVQAANARVAAAEARAEAAEARARAAEEHARELLAARAALAETMLQPQGLQEHQADLTSVGPPR